MKRIYNYHTGKTMIKESANGNSKNCSLRDCKLYEGVNRSARSRRARRINESRKPSRLCESVAFSDIIENSKSVYNTTKNYNARVLDLRKLLLSPSSKPKFGHGLAGPKPIAIWEHAGNFTAKELMNLCDKNGLTYCYISGKTFDGNIEDEYYLQNEGHNKTDRDETGVGDDIILIDNFTFGPSGKVEDIIDEIEYIRTYDFNHPLVICVGRIESPNNDIFADDLARIFTNYVLSTPDEEDTVPAYESVAERFGKYRKLYESDEDSADETEEDNDETAEPVEDAEKDNTKDDDTEDVPMTAIVLTIKKEDVDKCKEELIDAGIPEDAITEIDGDDDDENGKLKVDADYALELKDYLKGKGIDLEEKIGGEIIDDSAEDAEEDNDEEKSDDEKKDEEGDDEDFDAEFGDLFGDDTEDDAK